MLKCVSIEKANDMNLIEKAMNLIKSEMKTNVNFEERRHICA